MRLNKLNLKTFLLSGLTQGSRAPEGAIKATASTDNHAAGGNAAEHLFPLLESKLGDKKVRIRVVSQEVNSLSITPKNKWFH